MRLDGETARERFATARVARLATVTPAGSPHLVPIVFAVETETIYTAVDHKPKRTAALRRLANIAADPAVCVLADHYDEDWTQLWWARADGIARVIGPEDPAFGTAVGLLAGRYRQYQEDPPPGPVIAIRVRRWSGWAAWPAAHS